MTIQQKIESACVIAGISKTELGRRMGMSQQNFSGRLKTGKFSDKDFKLMSQALGCKYFSGFEFPDGTRIE
ncbi:helix-turn-helix transcriptional regulator [Mediterraneibacter sp. NSJ-55]|uniref:Helix-turn-helix transcriptional regulator n=1 Tax=Mediterraneibacter hominis TaxID=2763054 RepID=A0A923RP64_9FIRM|nr:helix-turn-helix transcriptional regulator [Mediterraneibacter hominis]MBC5688184.1 helix-turn-helix transcriptional regulator [Mediterraneibacter hominis]